MRLSEATIEILKNFSSLNEGIIINEGNLLTTKGGKDMFARAIVDDHFPKRCAVGNLPRLLGIISLMSEPEVEFGEHQLSITSGKQVVLITYAEFESINATDNLDGPTVPFSNVTFNLSGNDFQKLVRGASVLGLPEIAIDGDGASVTLRAVNSKDKTSDSFAVTVGETSSTFRIIVKVERLAKLLTRDFEVTLSKHGVLKLVNKDVTYFVAAQRNESEVGDLT